MTIHRLAMLAALVHQRRRSDLPAAQDGWVLVIHAPPGVAVEGPPVVIGGSKEQYITGLRRLRGEED
jgi:hypothetical protein